VDFAIWQSTFPNSTFDTVIFGQKVNTSVENWSEGKFSFSLYKIQSP